MQKILILCISILMSEIALSQKFYPSGNLPLYNFSPQEYPYQHPKNTDIIKGDDGLIYVANPGGILIYDGVSWNIAGGYREKTNVLSKSKDGKILVGGENHHGYLWHDSIIGLTNYNTLSNQLPDSVSKFRRTFDIASYENDIYFITENWIFHYENLSLKHVSPKFKYHGHFFYNGHLYVNLGENGFNKFEKGRFIKIESNEQFQYQNNYLIRGDSILSMSPGGLKIYKIEDQKIYLLSQHSFESDFSDFSFSDINTYGDHFLIGTKRNGLLILNKDLQLVKQIGTNNSSIQVDYIESIELIDDHLAWLGLDKGITVIDLGSNYLHYGEYSKIEGTVNDLCLIGNMVYAGSVQGMHELDLEKDNFFKLAFENIGECWGLTPVVNKSNSNLLLSLSSSIVYTENNKIKTIAGALPYKILQSSFNPNRFWVGTENGFMTILKKNDGFVVEYENNSLNTSILNLAQDTMGNIWLSSKLGGVFRIDEEKFNSDKYIEPVFCSDEQKIPATSSVYPFRVLGTIQFITENGIMEYDYENSEFNHSQLFHNPDSLNFDSIEFRKALFMAELPENRIFLVARNKDNSDFENGIFDIETKNWNYKPFIELSSSPYYQVILDENKEELWLGGTNGIYRIKNLNAFSKQEMKSWIRQVKYDPDSLLFGGYNFENFSNNTFNYSRKPLRFTFGAGSYKRKNDLKFKYYLEGFDDVWTDWNSEAEAVYTNLPGGKYTMRVKAIDFFENESEEASFAFTILPPWYLTPWAYALYFIGFIGFVYGAIRVSTISLQRVIKENTKEIVAQKDEIEAKNSVLETQKGRIEKQNLNILDSIRYAKRIQVATLPADDKISKFLDNAWVMYRPKDIVSGDFYWMENFKDDKDEKVMVAAVDCTGHGVPGAFMSIIGFNGLNRVVREYRLNRPSDILDRLNEIITTTLNQQDAKGEEIKDGMDISLCSLDKKSLILEYAGAHNSIYIIRKGNEKLEVDGKMINSELKEKGYSLFEIKADKQPIGAFENRKNFTNHIIKLLKDDLILLFTDGYADQFGGPNGKKFFYKPFKRLLLSVVDLPIEKQREIIETTFNEWISYPDSNGDAHEQIDDICVMGIRV